MAADTLLTDDDLSKYPTTRKEALATGAQFYFTGKSCIHRHAAKRDTLSRKCMQCHADFRNNYKPRNIKQHLETKQAYYDAHKRETLDRKAEYIRKLRRDEPWKYLIASARWRARKNEQDFTLTYNWGKEKWTGLCELTGIPFVTNKTQGPGPYSPTLDRIDNAKGYTQENTRFILFALNVGKGVLSDAQFLEIITRLFTSSWASQQRQLRASDLGECPPQGL